MNESEVFATKIRLETCKMLKERGFGHLGGALSIVELLAVLFNDVMNINPQNPKFIERDYFVLSKGHGGPSYYATLALKGYFDVEELKTINNDNTDIPSHPDRLKTVGVDASTGSLGQGISLAVGLAKGFAMSHKKNRVYTIVGDGECNEGQVWEAFQFVAHHKLDNLLIFIDENHKQLDGLTKDVLNPFDLAKKVESFGLHVQRVDGSSTTAIKNAIEEAKNRTGVPSCIVLDTVKGQGIPYFEKLADNHHIRFDDESNFELDKAIRELTCQLEIASHD